MTVSYSLHVITEIVGEEILKTLFQSEKIEPIAGTEILHTRGIVYLAHISATSQSMQEKFTGLFDFEPSFSVSYFPDGVSSVSTAMDMLLEAVMRWINNTDDDLLMVSNNRDIVLKRENGELTISSEHQFWSDNRLRNFKLAYTTL